MGYGYMNSTHNGWGRLRLQEDGEYCAQDYIHWCQQQKQLDDEFEYGIKCQGLDDAWRREAEEGQPTGSSSPVVEPYKKALLTAQKRLEKERSLKALKASPKEAAKKKDEKIDKKQAAMKPKEKSKAAKKKDEKIDKAKGKGKNQGKRGSVGPLTIAMKEFIAAQRANGVSYADAMKLWRTSATRAEIVGTLSASEQKRRRYV